MEHFRPIYPPLQWRVRTPRRYACGVLVTAAIMSMCWLVSAEPGRVALGTVILIQLEFLLIDAARYWHWSRKRPSAG